MSWRMAAGIWRYAIGCLTPEKMDAGSSRISVYHDERMAVFKAEVYNSADRKLAEAYGSRLAAVEPYYLEHAETGAIGRCLSEAGYNLYTYELSDNIEDHAITLDEGEEYLNVPYRVAMFKKGTSGRHLLPKNF